MKNEKKTRSVFRIQSECIEVVLSFLHATLFYKVMTAFNARGKLVGTDGTKYQKVT